MADPRRFGRTERQYSGIMNPHIRERGLRSLRTPSEQTRGPVGRGPLSTAEAAYHRGNVERKRGTFLDLLKKFTPRGLNKFRGLQPATPYDINVPLPYSPPGQTIGPAGRNPLTRSEMIANQAIAERGEREKEWFDEDWNFRGEGMIPIPTDIPTGKTAEFIGNTGQYLDPSFEMGTGIEYQVPPSGGGGIRYAGTPWGTADINLGRTYDDPMETNRPVERHQFPFTGFEGLFGPDDLTRSQVGEAWEAQNAPESLETTRPSSALLRLLGYSRGGIASLKYAR